MIKVNSKQNIIKCIMHISFLFVYTLGKTRYIDLRMIQASKTCYSLKIDCMNYLNMGDIMFENGSSRTVRL